MMTNATIHRQYQPGRSPLLGLAAVVATAATLGVAVLLPAQSAPYAPITVAQPAAESTIQVVTLPPVEVVGTRTTKSARNERWALPVLFRKNG
jgi:ABC-type transport system involved in cytochrome c biogenesis permease subunit